MNKAQLTAQLETINALMVNELAQPKPNEAILATLGMFKGMSERKIDKTIYQEPDMRPAPVLTEEGVKNLPWWVEL